MRLFIGIDLPPGIKNHIGNFLLPLKNSPKGWENPHDFHLTLLFIGEVRLEEKDSIVERMKKFRGPSLHLTLDGIKFFNRRIMYVSFRPTKELLDLKNEIEGMFSEWVRPETKMFIPHVTVKRWQRYEYDNLLKGVNRKAFEEKIFCVSEISLFESRKDAENNKYHVIFKTPL